jgi:hypothetical protein
MVKTILLCSAILTAEQKDARPLKLDVTAVPEREAVQEDLVFLRAKITNTGNEPVMLPVYWILQFALIGEKSGRIEDSRPFPSCGYRTPYVKVLGPHECRTIDYSARPLRIVRADKTNAAPLVQSSEMFTIRAIAAGYDDRRFEADTGPILVRRRPANEEALLAKSWGASGVGTGDESFFHMASAMFGWARGEGCETIEDLRLLERSLSPGTLRDSVRLGVMMETIDNEKNRTRRAEIQRELLKWLESLPEVERHWMALAVSSWYVDFSWHTTKQPLVFDFVYEITGRLPADYLARDYCEYQRHNYAKYYPTFADYLKAQGVDYAWLDDPNDRYTDWDCKAGWRLPSVFDETVASGRAAKLRAERLVPNGLVTRPDAVDDAAKANPQGSLKLSVTVFPEREIMEGDLLFLRVRVTNTGQETISVPAHANPKWGSMRFLLSGADRRTGMVIPGIPGFPQWGVARPDDDTPLAPGQSRALYYLREIVNVPPDWLIRGKDPQIVPADQKLFWRNLGDRIRIEAQVPLHIEPHLPSSVEDVLPFTEQWIVADGVLVARCAPIVLKPRPAEELALLRKRWSSPPAGALSRSRIRDRAAAAAMLPRGCVTPEELATLERSLSPGTLRDMVHLYRLLTAIESEEKQPRPRESVRELLKWLDMLPEIERYCIAIWIRGLGLLEPKEDDLIHGLADRLPADDRARD